MNKVILIIAALIVVAFICQCFIVMNESTYTVTVLEKNNLVEVNFHSHMVVCQDVNTKEIYNFKDSNSFLRGKDNAKELYQQLEIGKTYEITVYGIEVQFLNWYKNIIEIKPV